MNVKRTKKDRMGEGEREKEDGMKEHTDRQRERKTNKGREKTKRKQDRVNFSSKPSLQDNETVLYTKGSLGYV